MKSRVFGFKGFLAGSISLILLLLASSSIVESKPKWPAEINNSEIKDFYHCVYIFFICTDYVGSWPSNKASCVRYYERCINLLNRNKDGASGVVTDLGTGQDQGTPILPSTDNTESDNDLGDQGGLPPPSGGPGSINNNAADSGNDGSDSNNDNANPDNGSNLPPPDNGTGADNNVAGGAGDDDNGNEGGADESNSPVDNGGADTGDADINGSDGINAADNEESNDNDSNGNDGDTGIADVDDDDDDNGSSGDTAGNGDGLGNGSDDGSDGNGTDNGSDNGPAENGSDNGPTDNGSDNGPADNGSDSDPADNGSDNGPADNGSDDGPADNGPADNGSDDAVNGSENGSNEENGDGNTVDGNNGDDDDGTGTDDSSEANTSADTDANTSAVDDGANNGNETETDEIIENDDAVNDAEDGSNIADTSGTADTAVEGGGADDGEDSVDNGSDSGDGGNGGDDDEAPEGPRLPASCKELLDLGNTETKLYQIQLGSEIKTVYCDMSDNSGRGGGWTVIQRRGDYGNPPDYFFRNWTDYKEGFGNPAEDHWLGLDAIHNLAPGDNGVQVQLMVSMEDFEDNSTSLIVNNFTISDEDSGYKISYLNYNSKMGNSLPARETKFSTVDRDNDVWSKNCAERFEGAWWYSACHNSNLNGMYLEGPHDSFGTGVNWFHFRGYKYSLKFAEMKVRVKEEEAPPPSPPAGN